MKISPLLVVPKPNSDKFRVCSNKSFGSPSPNSLIDKSKINIALDSIQSWIPFLIEAKKKYGSVNLFKCDIDAAYRMVPIHPQYQMRQVVKVRDNMFVNRCCDFGSSSSVHLFCAVDSTILYVAEKVFGIKNLSNFMDDTWGLCDSSLMIDFKGRRIPLVQAQLLTIFDWLGVPWSWKKQVFGPVLEIISHTIDSEKMTVTLPPSKKAELVAAIRDFISKPKQPLVKWQCIGGWASWGLNSMPLGRFALQSVWDKIGGKSERDKNVYLSREVKEDLVWLADYFEQSSGMSFFIFSRPAFLRVHAVSIFFDLIMFCMYIRLTFSFHLRCVCLRISTLGACRGRQFFLHGCLPNRSWYLGPGLKFCLVAFLAPTFS